MSAGNVLSATLNSQFERVLANETSPDPKIDARLLDSSICTIGVLLGGKDVVGAPTPILRGVEVSRLHLRLYGKLLSTETARDNYIRVSVV